MIVSVRKSLLGCGVAIAALSLATQALAQQRVFDIPAQDAASAIAQFGLQADVQITAPADQLRGVRTRAVGGDLDARRALAVLLQGTGLEIASDNGRVIALRRVAPSPQVPPAEPAQLEEIVVTGTRIRGGDTPSPVIAIGGQRMREEGFTDLGEVVRSVSQNFAGGQNPGVASGNLAGAGNANQNITGGASLNLRGLGPDATLTLLNGRRMAYGGFVQAVDVSAIPIEAVDRIEIVADGASAIYGSDAVGGVANVILRRDHEGLTVGARHGGATDGGLSTREYSATAGHRWASGGVLATYRNASVDPIYSRQRDYADHLFDPTTLYPGSDLQSGLISIHQWFGDSLELRLDALRTERDQIHFYNVGGVNHRTTPSTATSLIAPALEVSLPNDWSLSLGAAWGTDEHDQYRVSTVRATGVSTVATDACYCNESRTYEAGAEGSLFALPGGDARLALGAGYRDIEFRQVDNRTGAAAIQGDESARFAYAEIHLPLIGPDQDIPGVRRLAMTAALRGEDYSSFGSVTTPKLGLIYAPTPNFTLSASWGESFKAPTLFERNYAASAYLYAPAVFGGTGYPADATVMVYDGGNADLQPERAETWSATAAFRPSDLPGLEAELTYFNVDYTDRVVQPIANAAQALSNPIYAPFVAHAPSPQTQAAIIADADAFLNFSGRAYDPARVAAIIYTQYANVARQEIQGVDLSGTYSTDLGAGRLTVRGSATWLDSTQQTLPTQAPHDLSGTLFRPAEVKGRAGLVWRQGGLTASAFANYASGVTDTVSGDTTGSFSTFDAGVRYALGAERGLLSGVEVALSAQNILHRAPPLYAPARINEAAPYDSANYSAVGRFVSISLSRRFGPVR